MQRFESIDGFRAILAWWVVVSHCLGWAGFAWQDLDRPLVYLRNGHIPVYGFIIVSGFVITHLLVSKREPYGVFILRRFFRLWPVMALTVVFVALLDLANLVPLRLKDSPWALHAGLELSMLHGLVPRGVLGALPNVLTGPGWSVSLEWQFYLVAPFMLAALTTRSFWRWPLLAVIVLLIVSGGARDNDSITFFDQTWRWHQPSFLPLTLKLFAVGMGSYWLLQQGPKFPTLAAGLAAAGLIYGLSPTAGIAVALALWAVMFAVLAQDRSTLAAILSSRPLRFLGEISYSTYLLHLPIVILVHRKIARGLTEPETWARFWLILAVATPLILAASWLSYRFVEKPGIAFAKRLAARWRGGPGAAKPDPEPA